LRILEEHAALHERMAARVEGRQLAAAAEHFHRRAADSRERASVLRGVLLAGPSAGGADERRETG
jgi:hypothetical protein